MTTVVIHGGAGSLPKNLYKDHEIEEYKSALNEVLNMSYELLLQDKSALDVVCHAVSLLEDCPLFNAGRGSVLSADGRIQMDASLMCGNTLKSGAVTLVEKVKNPIQAARLVMEKTPHRLLGAKDVENLARDHGLKLENLEYFRTGKRVSQLEEARRSGKIILDHDDNSNTVGAVALDKNGNIAAATSTGGLTNKLSGRVSDSSIVGAGTYANNESLAISATGTGDVFIRNVSCYDAHALMTYSHLGLGEACEKVLVKLKSGGGHGGVIALNRSGDVYLGFNSGGMFRGVKSSSGRSEVDIF